MAKATSKKNSVSKNVTETVDVNEAAVTETVAEEKAITPKEIDMSQQIPVYNGFHGKLIYKSSRTGETFRWMEFGDEQDIELRELRNARNTGKAFFENNWFMFDDEYKWVIDYLGVGRYYKYAINIDEFDELFEKDPDDITEIISVMSSGQKNSLAYRARQLVADGTIDSRRVIAALETSLGVELIER